LTKVRSKETKVVVAALIRQVRKLPATLKRSLTWDRGLEMAKHKDFTVATDVRVYFCDPQGPWQRGTNEKHQSAITITFPGPRKNKWNLRRKRKSGPVRSGFRYIEIAGFLKDFNLNALA
jgi:hypothetical protein